MVETIAQLASKSFILNFWVFSLKMVKFITAGGHVPSGNQWKGRITFQVLTAIAVLAALLSGWSIYSAQKQAGSAQTTAHSPMIECRCKALMSVCSGWSHKKLFNCLSAYTGRRQWYLHLQCWFSPSTPSSTLTLLALYSQFKNTSLNEQTHLVLNLLFPRSRIVNWAMEIDQFLWLIKNAQKYPESELFLQVKLISAWPLTPRLTVSGSKARRRATESILAASASLTHKS